MAFFEQKRFREALDCYGEAARLQPGKGAFHGNRAAAALKLGRHREAREAAEAAVALDAGCARDSPPRGATGPAQLGRRAEAAPAHLIAAAGTRGIRRGSGRRSLPWGAPPGSAGRPS